MNCRPLWWGHQLISKPDYFGQWFKISFEYSRYNYIMYGVSFKQNTVDAASNSIGHIMSSSTYYVLFLKTKVSVSVLS